MVAESLPARDRDDGRDTSKSGTLLGPTDSARERIPRGHPARNPRLTRGRQNLTEVRGNACPVLNRVSMMAILSLRLVKFL